MDNAYFRRSSVVAAVLAAALVSCTTAVPPAPPQAAAPPTAVPPPTLAVSFIGLRGAGPERAEAVFTVTVENSGDQDLELTALSAEALLDPDRDFPTVLAPRLDAALPVAIGPGQQSSFQLVVGLDLGTLVEAAAATAEATAAVDTTAREHRLRVRLGAKLQDATGKPIGLQTETLAGFPRIREPVFTITSIKISRAELINTRLKVSLRVDNPNVFPVELTTFSYELFGNNRFWADGALTKVLSVPAGASAGVDLALVMNFINMKRELLDQVIALREVDYRFAGRATVGTGFDYLPVFPLRFDHQGVSAVVE